MEKIIEKMSETDWVMKVTLLAVLILYLHVKFLSPVMGKYPWLLTL